MTWVCNYVCDSHILYEYKACPPHSALGVWPTIYIVNLYINLHVFLVECDRWYKMDTSSLPDAIARFGHSADVYEKLAHFIFNITNILILEHIFISIIKSKTCTCISI